MLKKHSFIIFIITALSILIYSNTFDAGFHLDDQPSITENIYCHLETISVSGLLKAADLNHSVFRPLSYITFALNYYFGQLNVFGYHMVNIGIHIITGCLLYFLVYNLLSLPLLKAQFGESPLATSAICALLFASNPMQIQAVTYIVQRMTSMATMFYLLSLLLYLLAKTHPQSRFSLFSLSFLAGICAMACKEIGLTLPFFVLIMEFLFFSERDQKGLKKLFAIIIFIIVIISVFGSIFFSPAIRGKVESLIIQNPLDVGYRLLTEARVVLYYISLLAFPFPSRLNIDHDFLVSNGWFSPFTTLLSVLIILFLVVYAFHVRKKQPVVSFCIFWYFGNLAIESSVIPLALIYEHRMYLPSIGVILLITSIMTNNTFRFRSLSLVSLTLLCVLFSIFTFQRNQIWQNDISLWKDAAGKSPNLYRPYANLGSAYMDLGLYNDAIDALKQSIQNKPNVQSYNTLSAIFIKLQKLKIAEENVEESIALEPAYGRSHAILGKIYSRQFRYEEAWRAFNIAMVLDQDILNSEEFMHSAESARDALFIQYKKDIELNPKTVESRLRLGNLYLTIRQADLAQKEFEAILEQQPGHLGALSSMVSIYMHQTKWAQAEKLLKKIIIMDKEFAPAFLNLGMLFIQKGQKAKALKNLDKALMLSSDPIQQKKIRTLIHRVK